ncbi:BufA1 family periplasmic bufferin-type metallophore [Ferrimonas marina]|uniref:Uncharacterized membrane protein n=1 Tax=Ferrimonas marina TaxID=299255 RepID=A0A1M5P0C9_9GAMM|nr:DUF2282 domain-containing protein [Ferrimonas marina]SHG95208.1 Uncharacterized membrane protein [Ferrimonas marina]
MSQSKPLSTTLAGVMAVSFTLASAQALAVPDQPKNWEKCAGVAMKGMNDCGSLDGKHSCAGQAEKDNDPNEWVYVPEGTCAKIGGTVAKVKPAKDNDAG